VHWLFPAGGQQFATDYQTAKRYDVPPGNAWLKLDDQVGLEKFYVLAAAERLTDLETLLTTYTNAPRSEQAQIGTNIVTEIREMRKRFRQFATLAERPVSIAGNLRGLDIGDLAVEITAQNFYGKTFTIEHR
jgi:type IV secretory pathway ATPase VirB11/archaellum biosynthesis ATPase